MGLSDNQSTTDLLNRRWQVNPFGARYAAAETAKIIDGYVAEGQELKEEQVGEGQPDADQAAEQARVAEMSAAEVAKEAESAAAEHRAVAVAVAVVVAAEEAETLARKAQVTKKDQDANQVSKP